MTVYLDVIWILNLSFDLLLLLLTAIILKRSLKIWRLAAGALIGSSIILLMFTPLGPVVSEPAGKAVISILMVLLSFGFKRFRYFFQNLLMLYFVTFMLGGGIIGVHYFLQSEATYANGIVMTHSKGMGDPVSWMFVVIGFPAIWLFSKKRMEEAETKKIQYEEIVTVHIAIEQQFFELKGLVDSGNQLTDPLTKIPVMILDTKKAADRLPKELAEKVLKGDILEDFSNGDFPWLSRMRIIPYRGVGQSHQFLIGIKPDEVTILTENDRISVKKVIIGLSSSTLSTDGDFDCIVHPHMLKNGEAENVS
ncbi:sigma-E processing peptidase SpoIIGA [Metabacillus sp. RGM 3146]|uniref:sigma-E processing peptidase SpoIIGA n=1 Tax=Metabacillus sp. RGM 3146 TaxID=3401092 RepID=UPI003B9D8F76